MTVTGVGSLADRKLQDIVVALDAGFRSLLQDGPGGFVERRYLGRDLHLHPRVGGQLPGLVEGETNDVRGPVRREGERKDDHNDGDQYCRRDGPAYHPAPPPALLPGLLAKPVALPARAYRQCRPRAATQSRRRFRPASYASCVRRRRRGGVYLPCPHGAGRTGRDPPARRGASSIETKRSSGSFSRQRMTIFSSPAGRSARISLSGGGVLLRC